MYLKYISLSTRLQLILNFSFLYVSLKTLRRANLVYAIQTVCNMRRGRTGKLC